MLPTYQILLCGALKTEEISFKMNQGELWKRVVSEHANNKLFSVSNRVAAASSAINPRPDGRERGRNGPLHVSIAQKT